MDPKLKTILLPALALVIGGSLLGYVVWKRNQVATIDSFEECANAGYPVLQTYPPQCKTPDGKTFVQPISATPTPSVTPSPQVSAAKTPTLTPSPKPKVSPSPTQTTSQAPKVYRNTKYGFEIRYPAAVQLFEKEERSATKDQHGFSNTSIAKLGYNLQSSDVLAIIFQEHDIHSALTDYSRVVNTYSNPNYRLYSADGATVRAGSSALRVVDQWFDSGLGPMVRYVFTLNGDFLTFSFQVTSEHLDAYDQIVQSIIFIR